MSHLPFATQLKVALFTIISFLLRPFQSPRRVMVYTIRQLQRSADRLRDHAVNLRVQHVKLQETYKEMAANPQAHQQMLESLKSQIEFYADRINKVRSKILDLDAKLANLRAREVELGLKLDMIETQRMIAGILGHADTNTLDKLFDDLEKEIANDELVLKLREEIERGEYGVPSGN